MAICDKCHGDHVPGEAHNGPSLQSYIQAVGDSAEDEARDRVMGTNLASIKRGAIMDGYLAVSSNDMLAHLALPKSPETLCGKIVVRENPSAHLQCDICETLSGGNSFIKTNEAAYDEGAGTDIHEGQGSVIEQAFGLEGRDGNPHFASLEETIDSDDEILLKAFSIIAADDNPQDETAQLLEQRRIRERAWQERNEEHQMPTDDISSSFAPVHYTDDSGNIQVQQQHLDPTITRFLEQDTRIKKMDTNPELKATRIRIQNDIANGREPDAEDLEVLRSALGAIKLANECEYCGGNHGGSGKPESCPEYHKEEKSLDAYADQVDADERATSVPRGDNRFYDAAARIRGIMQDAYTTCANCKHHRDDHAVVPETSIKQNLRGCKGSDDCTCSLSKKGPGTTPGTYESQSAGLFRYIQGENVKLNKDSINQHLSLANGLLASRAITPVEHSFISDSLTNLDGIINRTQESDPIATYAVHSALTRIRNGASVDDALGLGKKAGAESIEVPREPTSSDDQPTKCVCGNVVLPGVSRCPACGKLTQEEYKPFGLASVLRQSAQKTATNWTLDGIPIEDGFTLMTPEEANGIPFLDTNKVSISNKIHCSGCDTDQWLPRVASCMQCNELKCIDCMSDIINEFVGSCKKCANIDEDDENLYLSYSDDDYVELQQFSAALDDDSYTVEDSFLPYYDS